MIEDLNKLIIEIHSLIGDNFIIVGSMSMYLNGYDIVPNKKEIDVCVTNIEHFETIRKLGENTVNKNGNRSPFNEEIRSFITKNDFFIDLYLRKEEISHQYSQIYQTKIKVANDEYYKEHYCGILRDYDFKTHDPSNKFKEKILRHIKLLNIKCL